MRKVFAGLRDTGEILKQTAEEEGVSGLRTGLFDELMRAWENPPDRIVDALRLLRRMETDVKVFAGAWRGSAGSTAGTAYWADQIEAQVSSWLGIGDRYLAWIEILGRKDRRGDRTARSGCIARMPRASASCTVASRCRQWKRRLRSDPPVDPGGGAVGGRAFLRMDRPPHGSLRAGAMAGR